MNARRIGILLVPFALFACGTGSSSGGSRLAVEFSVLDFGDVLIGSSRTLDVTVTNNRGSFREITGFSLSQFTSRDYAITSPYEEINLAPGASVTCRVTYSPAGEGVDLGSLIVESPGDPSSISLLGNGVPTPAPEIEVSAESLDFGEVLVGSSAALTVTIRNIGSAPLDVETSFDRVTSGDFDVRDFPRGELTPGASLSFEVTYLPDSERPDTGGLVVTSDDADEPEIAVALTGSGILAPAPEIHVAPLSLDFGEVLVSDSMTREFTVSNHGTETLEVSDIVFGDGVSEEFILIAPAGRTEIAPASEIVVEVVYAPEDEPADSGTLRIVSDDADEAVTLLSLSGVGALAAIPDIDVSPDSLDFGAVLVGNTSSLDVTVSNTGSAVLRVDSVSLGSGSSPNFAFAAAGTFDLDPSASRSFTIVYTADDQIADSAVLRVASNNADEGLVTVSLSGNGSRSSSPDISVSHPSLAFGSVTVGESVELRLSITNSGDAPLTIESVELGAATSSGFTVPSRPADGSVLGAGQSRAVDVAYAPRSDGVDTGSLRIASDDPDEPVIAVSLSGTGATAPVPEIDVAPPTLAFGNVLVGDSRELVISISNTGTAPLTITSVRLGGASSPSYTITSRPGDGTTIPVGQSRAVDVAYAPGAEGTDTGTVRILSDDENEPQVTVTLSGAGASNPLPEIDVDRSTLDFGSLVVGGSRARLFSITNVGAAPLTIHSVRLGGETSSGFELTTRPADSTVLLVGQSRTVEVTYSPAAEGVDTGTVRVTSDDEDEPVVTVVLSGTASAVPLPEIEVDRTTLTFGNLLVGDSRALSLSITNTGNAPLTIGSVRLGAGTSSSFALTTRPADGTAIQTGQSRAVEVTYAPGTEGSDAGTVRITSDDDDEPLLSVSLSGTASAAPLPEIVLSRSSLPFGSLLVGESRTLRLWITNSGDAPLTLASVRLGSGTSSSYALASGPADGTQVPAGRSTPVDVSYTPTSEGTDTGALRIASDDDDEPLVSVPLSGTATEPVVDTSVTLAWDAPTTDAAGAPLSDLTGFKLYVGGSPGDYTQVFDVGDATTHTLDSLPAGRYYVAVTAYNLSGESARSVEITFDLPLP